MIRLELKPNEGVDKAMRRFKKICDREGLTRDMRKHSYYEKPSERNKRKNREAEKERAKAIRVAEKKKTKARKARAKSLKRMSGPRQAPAGGPTVSASAPVAK
ncbi:MAG: 30S ribosomal protein S21 [Kiritimatiellaeota bacterium]|nr:30S ribosomal protein S21 [Kiritimatiellota bacterium]